MKRVSAPDLTLLVAIVCVFIGVWFELGIGFALIALGIMLGALSYLMATTESDDVPME